MCVEIPRPVTTPGVGTVRRRVSHAVACMHAMSVATHGGSLLTRLASCSERSRLLVLQESADCRARQLFRFFLRKSLANPTVHTFLLLLQSNSEDYSAFSAATLLPLLDDAALEQSHDLRTTLFRFGEQCEAGKGNRVFIDSLDALFQLNSLTDNRQLLSFLLQRCDSIVTTVLDAALDWQQRALVRSLSTTHITLSPAPAPAHLSARILIKRKHRTLSFKVERKEEMITFDGQEAHVSNVNHKKAPVPAATTAADMPKLTFNLSLNPEEKAARDQVQLPYERFVPQSKQQLQLTIASTQQNGDRVQGLLYSRRF